MTCCCWGWSWLSRGPRTRWSPAEGAVKGQSWQKKVVHRFSVPSWVLFNYLSCFSVIESDGGSAAMCFFLLTFTTLHLIQRFHIIKKRVICKSADNADWLNLDSFFIVNWLISVWIGCVKLYFILTYTNMITVINFLNFEKKNYQIFSSDFQSRLEQMVNGSVNIHWLTRTADKVSSVPRCSCLQFEPSQIFVMRLD